MKGPLFLIDGQSFCYRAFYAIRELSNSKGEPTNAIYGFVTMLRKMIRDYHPESIAVCFDRKEPTFRHDRYEDYKAHRKPMPDLLIEQIPHIKEIVRAYRIPTFELAGYEADDLLGTLAHKAEKAGYDVMIVTGDKDALQLVNDQVKVLNLFKEEVIDREGVKERFEGLGPEQVVEIMSLMGDSSDNIPGVPGIGEKTALKLVQKYHSLDKLIQSIDELKPAVQKALKENEQVARLSKDLATIDRNVPMEVNWDDMKLKEPDQKKLSELFSRFEFRTLLKELTPTGEAGDEKRNYQLVSDLPAFKKLAQKLKAADLIAVDTETTSTDPMRAHLVGISFSVKEREAYYVPVALKEHQGSGLEWKEIQKELKPILEDAKVKKCGQNVKYDYIVLKRHGINLNGIYFDTMVASYLVNPLKRQHNLDDISFEHLGVKKISVDTLIKDGRKEITMDLAPVEKVAEYAAEDADCVFRLVPIFEKLLKVHHMEDIFFNLEMPLVRVLAEIEMNGVALDVVFLNDLSKKLEGDLEKLTKDIYKEAGEEFNINSPKQLSDILFNKLKLPVIRRTKTGFSTDAEVLEKLALSYDLPKLLMEHREKSKLKSTYLDALPELVNPETNRVHTSFNQTVTATGRLSSSEPNFQNIPIKTDLGREIRRAFSVRAKGRKILSADYSQVELRVLAHFSGDENLMKAFQNDLDVHQFTATLLFGVELKDVTRKMRNVAKTINFSIVYGVSAFGLAQSLNVSISEAQNFIDSYFARYAGVKRFMDAQVMQARDQGFLTTLAGRKSFYPDIHSSNINVRQFSERTAINAPIQGSAADIIKLAMIHIQNELEKRKMDSVMILQVHDELVFDAPESELKELEKLVREGMEGAYKLKVPLKVDVKVGPNWYHE